MKIKIERDRKTDQITIKNENTKIVFDIEVMRRIVNLTGTSNGNTVRSLYSKKQWIVTSKDRQITLTNKDEKITFKISQISPYLRMY